MSAVGHYLEQEGIATVQISLIREHTQALRPPRALWVPFMLGRPFGSPNDEQFQLRVLKSALSLLNHVDGPILKDFPDDAPNQNVGDHDESLACPISFPRLVHTGSVEERLNDEVRQLSAWHALALTVRKRTTLGLTGETPIDLAKFIGSWLGGISQESFFNFPLHTPTALKRATDELKDFYFEAKVMQPGVHSPQSIQNWFWFETTAGEVFITLRIKLAEIGDPSFKALATSALVPRWVQNTLESESNQIMAKCFCKP